MLHIDLIDPKYSFLKKFLRVPVPGHLQYLSWFPVWYYKDNLKNRGIKIRFLDTFNLRHGKLSKIVGVSSGGVRYIENIESILRNLKKKVDLLLFFDQMDSPRLPKITILKIVDRYFKKQLLKDSSLYQENLYKNRLHFDYYARNYGLIKNLPKKKGRTLDPKLEKKIGISWNWAYNDYRHKNHLMQYLYNFTRKNKLNFTHPNKSRKYLVSANYNFYKHKTIVYFQREQLLKLLINMFKNNEIASLGRIPKKDYYNTQRDSRAVISPFGWGEICFRDFETFIAGAALIKPNMDHLITWPDLFIENKTYLPISWKIEEWENQIHEILSDERRLKKIAYSGQRAYKKLWSKEGSDEFCKRFIKMITPD